MMTDIDMKNKAISFKALFLKRVLYATVSFLIAMLFILLVAVKFYYANRIFMAQEDLLVNEAVAQDEIIQYIMLENEYALNMSLENLKTKKKLNSANIIYEKNKLPDTGLYSCFTDNKGKICIRSGNEYVGFNELSHNGDRIGYLITGKNYNVRSLKHFTNNLMFIVLIIMVVFIFSIYFLFMTMKKRIQNNVESLIEFAFSSVDGIQIGPYFDIDEFKKLAEQFKVEKGELIKLQNENAYYLAKKEISEQFAHDIKSPLAAINTALTEIGNMPENIRLLIKNAACQINGIASNLLSQDDNSNIPEIDHDISSQQIFIVLEDLISEKRIEYKYSQFSIEVSFTDESYSYFADVDIISFKRLLSNLINNSAESISDQGKIVISLFGDEKFVYLSVKDNGCGIPKHFISKITEKGMSLNKPHGAGLGLYFAKNQIEKIGGELVIASEEDKGTEVKIKLARALPPCWSLNELSIDKCSYVIIIDDDNSIHEVWEHRFKKTDRVKLFHFNEFTSNCIDTILHNEKALCLIDYELLGNHENGLDFIEKYKLEKRAMLVTSAHDNKIIKERAKKLKIKIIPKSFVPHVSINIMDKTYKMNTTVLIDDNSLLRETWELSAAAADEILLTFSSFYDFFLEIQNINIKSHIYIDSNLGNSVKGEDIAKELYEKGFTNIYLATGKQPCEFSNCYWIREVVGKEPPFKREQD